MFLYIVVKNIVSTISTPSKTTVFFLLLRKALFIVGNKRHNLSKILIDKLLANEVLYYNKLWGGHEKRCNQLIYWLHPFSAVRGGFEPPVRLPARQFSKLLVSATHPSHQDSKRLKKLWCKGSTFFWISKIFFQPHYNYR